MSLFRQHNLLILVGICFVLLLAALARVVIPDRPDAKLSGQSVLRVGHHGASSLAPSNTLQAFQLALEMGVDYIEPDVQASLDGKIVVFHDMTLDRLTPETGRVNAHTSAELQELNVGAWFVEKFPDQARPEFAQARIPTLEQVIALARQYDAGLMLDIKTDALAPAGEWIDHMIHLLRENSLLERSIFIAQAPPSLKRVRQAFPDARVGILYGNGGRALQLARKWSTNYMVAAGVNITTDNIQEAHSAGIGVIAYRVNESEEMHRLIEAGVDAILTGRPDLLNHAIARRKR